MTESRLKALEIIGAWIDSAHKRALTGHLLSFWLARDILEGLLNVSATDRMETIKFIRDNCKDSADKTSLLTELEADRE